MKVQPVQLCLAPSYRPKGSGNDEHGFSRIDLLFVSLAVAVLFVLGPANAVAKAKAKAQRISCVNNLKELGLAFRVFTTDNNDEYPLNEQFADRESARGKTNWVAGWMDFDAANPDNFELDARLSELANEIASPKLLGCPTDTSTIPVNGEARRRIRSYSMNGYVGQRMATVGDEQRGRIVKDSAAQPSIVLAMDESGRTLNDGAFTVVVPSMNDPHELQRAVRARSLPADYDGGSANMILLDGSVQQAGSLRKIAAAAASLDLESKRLQVFGSAEAGGTTLRKLFAPWGSEQAVLYVRSEPPDARVEWSEKGRNEWRPWSPEYTLVSACNLKVRASCHGYAPLTNFVEFLEDPIHHSIRLDRLQ